MSHEDERRDQRDDGADGREDGPELLSRRERKGGPVVPAWVVVPLAGAAGFFTADWAGLVLGLALGVFLWRIRR